MVVISVAPVKSIRHNFEIAAEFSLLAPDTASLSDPDSWYFPSKDSRSEL